MPEISVIVPVYKAEAYLKDCVDSILGQSFSDFEVFLVDDGSPDGCGAICEEYARKDSRVRVIHQENRGQAAARNRALEQAEGQWVCFVDSDDLIHPQMLQLLYRGAVENGAGISMCPMLEAPVLPESFYAAPLGAAQILHMNQQTLVQLYDREEYPSWVACAKLIRREYIRKHLFREGRVFEDNEAVCHWMYETEKLVRLPDPMYFYRTNPDSTTQKSFSPKQLDYLWALEQILCFYGSVGYEEMKERFIWRYVRAVADFGLRARVHLQDGDLAKKIEKQGKDFLRREGISLNREQKDTWLEALHPKQMIALWALRGAVRTLREEGISGLLRKRFHNQEETEA